jgi:hypothetical protein
LPKQPDTMAPFVPLFYNRYYPDAQQNWNIYINI